MTLAFTSLHSARLLNTHTPALPHRRPQATLHKPAPAAAAMAAAPSAPAQSEPLQQSPSLDRTPRHKSSVILTATIERVCLTAHEQSRHATVHETDSIRDE